MPGQVVEESILGDNREKTKLYWETRMRHDTSEKEKANGYNKFRSSTSSTSSVIQKMNAEMKELHRRERELSHKTAKATDEEDDVFSSSNGSSVDEFEHAESPRLESGFYSNLGEDEPFNTESPDLAAETTRDFERPVTPLMIVTTQTEVRASSVEVSNNLLEAVESSSPRIFTFHKETPIEREIRLASERDEEHRQRLSSVATPTDFHVTPVMSPGPATPTAKVSVRKEEAISNAIPASSVKPSVIKEKERRGSGAREPARNLQYKLATERLKREILEVQQREDELKARSRSTSKAGSPAPVTHSPQLTHHEQIEPKPKIEQKVEQLPPTDPEPVKKTKPKPEPLVNVSIVETVRETSPAERRTSTAMSPGPGDATGPELTQFKAKMLGRPSFNSMQRYLLKSSVQLRIAKNFQLPTPVPVEVPETPKDEAEEVEEPVTPRRKLVPAQHKIKEELREMREREQELALTRTYKSTPNLTMLDLDETQAEEVNNNEKEVKKPKAERKRSNLINEWEGKIQAGN